MIRKDDNDPLGPIGSRFEEKLERAASKIEHGRARATSRLDRPWASSRRTSPSRSVKPLEPDDEPAPPATSTAATSSARSV